MLHMSSRLFSWQLWFVLKAEHAFINLTTPAMYKCYFWKHWQIIVTQMVIGVIPIHKHNSGTRRETRVWILTQELDEQKQETVRFKWQWPCMPCCVFILFCNWSHSNRSLFSKKKTQGFCKHQKARFSIMGSNKQCNAIYNVCRLLVVLHREVRIW